MKNKIGNISPQLKRVRLDEDDEGVPSSALREICLLKGMKKLLEENSKFKENFF